MKRTYFIDCGGLQGTVLDSVTGKVEKIKPDEILKLQDRLKPGDRIIGEASHFAEPKRGLSRAQYFHINELLKWYEDCAKKGVELGFFASKMTEKSRRLIGIPHKMGDKEDLWAIKAYLEKFPKYHLMKPRTSLETRPVVEEGWDVKEEMNAMLNVARDRDYQDKDDKASVWLRENLPKITQAVSPQTRDVFCLGLKKDGTMRISAQTIKGETKPALKFKQVYTVLSSLMNFDGTPRLRGNTNEVSGWKNAKQHYFGNSPHHGNGGVARSNLFWHGMRHYISRKQGNRVLNKKGHSVMKKIEAFTDHDWDTFRDHRKEYRDAVRDLFQVMRKMVVGI